MTPRSWLVPTLLLALSVALAGCAGGAEESNDDDGFADGGNYPEEQTIVVTDNSTDETAVNETDATNESTTGGA